MVLLRRQYEALAELRYEIRRFLRFSEQAARAAELEPQQHQLLLALKGLPRSTKPTISALAERLQIKHHSAVELVSRLEARGLIRRYRDHSDRRNVLIQITRKGEEILQDLSVHHVAELKTIGPALVNGLNALISDGTRSKGTVIAITPFLRRRRMGYEEK